MMIKLKSAKTRISYAAVEFVCVCECVWGKQGCGWGLYARMYIVTPRHLFYFGEESLSSAVGTGNVASNGPDNWTSSGDGTAEYKI